MRGSLHPLTLILLLLLTVSGQQGEGENGIETDSSDEANPSETSDQQGTTSEEEVCSDCEETGNTIEEGEEVANNATELNVLDSATFSMASVGSTSISVRLDRVDGRENLQMVCQ